MRLGSCQWLQILPYADPLLFELGQLLFKSAGKVVLRLHPLIAGLIVLMAISIWASRAEILPPKRCEQITLSLWEIWPFGRRCLLVFEGGGFGAGRGSGAGEETRLNNDLGFAPSDSRGILDGHVVIKRPLKNERLLFVRAARLNPLAWLRAYAIGRAKWVLYDWVS